MSIDYVKADENSCNDGMKGYLTNTEVSTGREVYEDYHNHWTLEHSLRIAKSKIEMCFISHLQDADIDVYNASVSLP